MIPKGEWLPEAFRLSKDGAAVGSAYEALCNGRVSEISTKDAERLKHELLYALKTTSATKAGLTQAANTPQYPGKYDAQEMLKEGKRIELRLKELQAELKRRGDEFTEIMGVAPEEFRQRVLKACRDVLTPPLTSAKNVEVAAMGIPHLISRLSDSEASPDTATAAQIVEICSSVMEFGPNSELYQRVRKYHGTTVVQASGGDRALTDDIYTFLIVWRRCSYARLEIGHRLAASLCMTDVSGFSDVHMPWPAWSLVVPDGLLGDQVARIWVLDTGENTVDRKKAVIVLDRHGKHPGKLSPVTQEMFASLVFGSALALSNPEEFKKDRQHKPSGHSSKGRKSGPPDLDQARYMLSAAVSIDLREHVQAALDDERAGKRRGSSPKVQFLVRGHWRRQACGPGLTERKTIWIQPFWKGPEESRVLLRAHKVEEK